MTALNVALECPDFVNRIIAVMLTVSLEDDEFVDAKRHEIMFTDPKYKTVSPHLTVRLSRSSNGRFPITVYHNQHKIRCLMKVGFDPQSLCKVFTLVPVLTAVSFLPAPLYLKFGETVVTMEEGEDHELPYVDPQSGNITASFSLGCPDEFTEPIQVPFKKSSISAE